MFELYSFIQVSLNAKQGEVINGQRVVGREGGCAGHSRSLELGVIGGTPTANLAVLQSVSRV